MSTNNNAHKFKAQLLETWIKSEIPEVVITPKFYMAFTTLECKYKSLYFVVQINNEDEDLDKDFEDFQAKSHSYYSSKCPFNIKQMIAEIKKISSIMEGPLLKKFKNKRYFNIDTMSCEIVGKTYSVSCDVIKDRLSIEFFPNVNDLSLCFTLPGEPYYSVKLSEYFLDEEKHIADIQLVLKNMKKFKDIMDEEFYKNLKEFKEKMRLLHKEKYGF